MASAMIHLGEFPLMLVRVMVQPTCVCSIMALHIVDNFTALAAHFVQYAILYSGLLLRVQIFPTLKK